MGIGAFNAIRASTYRAIGGHTRIAMRPDDDIKLGKLVKRSGARQQVALGMGLLSVRWYSTLGDMVRGLRKNSFLGVRGVLDALLAVAAVLGQLLLNVWPFVAVAVTSDVTRELYGIAAVLLMTMYALAAHGGGSRPWLALFYPVAAAILAYIVASATTRTVLRGGIEWRSILLSTVRAQAERGVTDPSQSLARGPRPGMSNWPPARIDYSTSTSSSHDFPGSTQ